MFTGLMWEKLADWFGNASILCLSTVVLPGLLGTGDLLAAEFVAGLSLVVLFLWISLRCARLAKDD